MQPCQSQGCGGGSGECSSSGQEGTSGCSKGGGSWGSAGGATGRPKLRPNCMKCKKVPAVVTVRQREPLCWDCLEYNVLCKVRYAVKTQGLIQPGDRVLVPVSGGPASLALVYLLLQMRSTNKERLERGKVVFQLEVVHVDEGAAVGLPEEQAAALAEGVVASVRAAGHEADTPVLPLLPGADDGSIPDDDPLLRLGASLAGISDVTAREDAVQCLRRRCVQQYARQAGCNKIAWGDCASSTAVQIMADFAKGRGFSLSADIQALDARGGEGQAASIYLQRGVSAKELAMLCRHRGVRFWSMPVLPQQARSSINQLAEAFMEGLQAQVPHTVYTVIRTASHLQPFPFNALPPAASSTSRPSASPTVQTPTPPSTSSSSHTPAAAQQEQASAAAGHGTAADVPLDVQQWCRVCDAPLPPAPPGGKTGDGVGLVPPWQTCYSCRSQFGKYVVDA